MGAYPIFGSRSGVIWLLFKAAATLGENSDTIFVRKWREI